MHSSLPAWMSATEESAREFVLTTLAGEPYAVLERCQQLPETGQGAFVPLTGEKVEAIIGIWGDPCDCLRLVRVFGALAEGEPVPETEMADTLGEIANILAGSIKARMAVFFPGLRIGMPRPQHGRLQLEEAFHVTVVRSKWGGMEILLAVGIKEKGGDDEPC